MALARGIVFLLVSFATGVIALGGAMTDGDFSGGVLLLHLLSLAFGWLAWRELRPREKRAAFRRRLSGNRLDKHLQRQVEAHLADLARQQRH